MFARSLLLICTIIGSTSVSAFSCYITVVKDSCWTDYNVTVNAIDTSNKKIVATADIPGKQSWARIPFECEPHQQLEYQASFTPSFWDSEKNKIYRSKGYRLLNSVIQPTETAWNVPICFPAEFQEVPFPPRGDRNCKCDFAAVPPLETNKDAK